MIVNNNLEENVNTKLGFEPCYVEVVHFGEDIMLTSESTSVVVDEGEQTKP